MSIRWALFLFALCLKASDCQSYEMNNKNTMDATEENNSFLFSPTSLSLDETTRELDIIIDAIQQSRSHRNTNRVFALIFESNGGENHQDFVANCQRLHPRRLQELSESGSVVDRVLRQLQASFKTVLVKRLILDEMSKRAKTSNNCDDDRVVSQMDVFADAKRQQSNSVDDPPMR